MVEESLALMAELSDDDTVNEADIYLDPPSNKVTDEDCGKEYCIDMNNLTEGPLRANVVVILRRQYQNKQIIGESDNEDEHGIVTHNRNRVKKQRFPKKKFLTGLEMNCQKTIPFS
ncbi:hypothetical protein NPIL_77251 [Nephila pilipes]|uniref:Uncharacterized protein n=1 Tax=Nephila pilipes TaxID=299642 RepID=A0A8X6QK28_NEPPI|nr:hypothetical protein NPIL_77251 [Nephila pilipes]